MNARSVIYGAVLLLVVLVSFLCYQSLTQEAESKSEPYYCIEIRNTIIGYIHARRTLNCRNTRHTQMALVHMHEVETLMCMYEGSGCLSQELFKDIMKHVGVCESCRDYLKCTAEEM